MERGLADPVVWNDPDRAQKLDKERASLGQVGRKYIASLSDDLNEYPESWLKLPPMTRMQIR